MRRSASVARLGREGRELQLAGRPSRDTSGILWMRVKEPYTFEAAVTLELPEIRPLLMSEGHVAPRASRRLTTDALGGGR